MTEEQLNLLNLNNVPIIFAESALQWVLKHTTLEFDMNNSEELRALPASVKLFCLKYYELMSTSEGVTSESIEGLSQSFNTSNKSGLIWQLAESLLDDYLVSSVSFVSASKRW